jgi:hypothetical protein
VQRFKSPGAAPRGPSYFRVSRRGVGSFEAEFGRKRAPCYPLFNRAAVQQKIGRQTLRSREHFEISRQQIAKHEPSRSTLAILEVLVTRGRQKNRIRRPQKSQRKLTIVMVGSAARSKVRGRLSDARREKSSSLSRLSFASFCNQSC